MLYCKRCGKQESETQIDSHHIIPKSCGGRDSDRVYLCVKCHNILHNILPSILWKHISDKSRAINAIKKFTFYYVKKSEVKKNETIR